VDKQLELFQKYDLVDRITYQSFDWRTIKQAKTILPNLTTAALAESAQPITCLADNG
jgi:glycerophosphoryl diester phosphodiesterase